MARTGIKKTEDAEPGWVKNLLRSNVIVVVLLVLGPTALFGGWYSMGGVRSSPSSAFYYYDPATGELFTTPAFSVGPVAAPSDEQGKQTGVLARVFSCTACSDKASRKVGYLESYDPKAVAKVFPGKTEGLTENMVAQGLGEVAPEGILIRTAGPESQWVTQNSKQGKALLEAAASQCPDASVPKECRP